MFLIMIFDENLRLFDLHNRHRCHNRPETKTIKNWPLWTMTRWCWRKILASIIGHHVAMSIISIAIEVKFLHFWKFINFTLFVGYILENEIFSYVLLISFVVWFFNLFIFTVPLQSRRGTHGNSNCLHLSKIFYFFSPLFVLYFKW